MFEVVEGHKLHNVPQDGFSFRRAEDSIITVQHLHVTEIRAAYADNDDGHGQVRGVDDGLSSVRHICDHTVRQYEQDEVLLHQSKKRKTLEQQKL